VTSPAPSKVRFRVDPGDVPSGLKKIKSKGTPTDKKFGWYFDSIWPSGYSLRQEDGAP